MNETNAGGVRQRSVEIVVPVHNEAHVLGDSIGRLHAYLEASFPFPFRITVADNASTDATWQAATGLTARLPHVHAVHLAAKGRGRALKYVWSRSEADVVAYMDVDLSTGLDGFLPLVAPLLSGHSDLAIGSRLHPQAAVVRGPKREFVSRSYNLLLKLGLAARFSDAQCGFKAVRTEIFRALGPHIEDNTWFFDTELLVLAERNRLRIHEVPVDWVDDPDSRVDIVATAVDDLKGMGRMQRRILTGRTRVALPPRAGTAHTTAAAHGAASVEPGPGGGGNHASAERTSPATGVERMSPAAGAERTSPAAGAAAPPARARAA